MRAYEGAQGRFYFSNEGGVVCAHIMDSVVSRTNPYSLQSTSQECHCMLFLTEDNDFRGDDQTMTLDQVVEMTQGM